MNKSTRIFVVIMGILTGFGGLGHGIAEIIQGNKPTVDIGTRIGAFSIVPNYLLTGILAFFFSILIVICTIGFIHKKYGSSIYLLLSIVLFLVGGGIAQTLGIIITWLVSTRINKPLTFWSSIIKANSRNMLARLWLPAMITGYTLLLIGIGIWLIFTPPGIVHKISFYHYLCWTSLLSGLIFILLAIVFGFARDIKMNEGK